MREACHIYFDSFYAMSCRERGCAHLSMLQGRLPQRRRWPPGWRTAGLSKPLQGRFGGTHDKDVVTMLQEQELNVRKCHILTRTLFEKMVAVITSSSRPACTTCVLLTSNTFKSMFI